MKSAVLSLLIGCFIFGGIAWRVHYRRSCKSGSCKAVKIILCTECK